MYRIQFKILILIFKCLYGTAPGYLCDLVSVIRQNRYSLRSMNSVLLTPGSAKCKVSLGDCAFQTAAPKLWNKLPGHIRNLQSLEKFKTEVKTYLFKLAFDF